MGESREASPVVLFVAAFSRHLEALEWGRRRFEELAGPVELVGGPFEFTQTRYYESAMGEGLRKVLWGFRDLVAPETLVEWKLRSNAWEQECVESGGYSESRPLNLDPGYVTEAKLVLATTKDRDHRLYLGRGIYGEVTLHRHAGQWATRPWTYADYALPEYHEFVERCREHLRRIVRSGSHMQVDKRRTPPGEEWTDDRRA